MQGVVATPFTKEREWSGMNTYEVISLMISSCMLVISLISLILAIVKAILGQKNNQFCVTTALCGTVAFIYYYNIFLSKVNSYFYFLHDKSTNTFPTKTSAREFLKKCHFSIHILVGLLFLGNIFQYYSDMVLENSECTIYPLV